MEEIDWKDIGETFVGLVMFWISTGVMVTQEHVFTKVTE